MWQGMMEADCGQNFSISACEQCAPQETTIAQEGTFFYASLFIGLPVLFVIILYNN